MPDPDTLSHIVRHTLTIQAAGASLNGNLIAQITPTLPHTHFLERDRLFEGSPGQILSQLRDLGFSTTEEGYLMAQAVLSNQPATRQLYVGRREAGESLTDSMNAIKASYGGDPLPWYAFACPVRDNASIIELSNWGDNEFVVFWALSKDPTVLTNTPGNIFDQLKALNRPRTIIGWSDPIRVAKPAVVSTTLETFALAPYLVGAVYTDHNLAVSVNGGPLQNISFPATRAELTASAETYNFANLEQLDIRYNQSTDTTSTVFEGVAPSMVSGAPETYNFSGAPLTMTIEVDGVSALITFVGADFAVPSAGLASEVVLRINTDFGSAIASVVNISGKDYVQLDSSINGLNGSIKVTEGTGANAILKFSTSELKGTGNVGDLSAVRANEVAALSQIEAGQEAVWSVVAGPAPKVTSTRFGTTSEIEILGTSSANVLTELGFVVGVTNGSGFAKNADAAKADEVEAVVAAFADLTTDDSTGRVIFTTVALTSDASIQFSDTSSALDALGLNDSLVTGSGTDEDYAELRLMGFTYAVDQLANGSFNPQFVQLNGATHSGINATERTNIKKNHGWMLDPDNGGKTFAVQMANAPLTSDVFGYTLETRHAADIFKINATQQCVNAFNLAAQAKSKVPANYTGILENGAILRSVIEQMGPEGSGHFRALGDPTDPQFDPVLNSSIKIPRLDEIDRIALQNGILGTYEISLVVLPSGQRIDIDTTVIASNVA